MNRQMIAAAALLAGVAIAAPMAASSAADDAPRSAQAGPGDMRHGQMGPGHMGRGGWSDDDDNDRGPGQHGGPFHRWMQHGAEMSPQQHCEEHLARRAGMIAYTLAKLNLSEQQRPLWDKVQALLQQADDRERQRCGTLKPRDQRSQETLLDRVNRREQFLSTKLQALQQVKPALEQFYAALTPEQKAIIDHPFKRRRG